MDDTKVATMQKQRKVTYWIYDDGSAAAMVFGKKGKRSKELKCFGSERELKEFFRSKQKYLMERIKPNYGIHRHAGDIFASTNIDLEELQNCFTELEKMLASYAMKGKESTLWNLFAYILSGYIARRFGCKVYGERPIFYRAPIVRIVGHKKDICSGFEHLARLVKSMSVDTTKDQKLIFNNPPVIPSARIVDSITECAHICVERDKEERHAPTMYRDTAVLIHSYFFKKSDLESFISRNPWACILVFGKTVKNETNLVWPIDMNELSLPEWTWSLEHVNNLMTAFYQWLSLTIVSEDLRMRWVVWENVAEEILLKNQLAKSANRLPKMEGSERAYKVLQIESLFAFIDFCYLNRIIDDCKRKALLCDWINGLLGNGYNYVKTVVEQEKKYNAEEAENNRILEEFKLLIKFILETKDGDHVKFVGRGQKFAETDVLDIENGPWAQLFWTEPKDEKGKKYRAVKIRKEDILTLCRANGLLNYGEDFGRLKNAFENNTYSREKCDFICAFKNERFNFIRCTDPVNQKPVQSVVLYLDKIIFIDEKIKIKLVNKFPEKK